MKRMTLILFVIIFAAVNGAEGMPTRLLNYQGVLLGSGGSVAADGFYDITFRIYDVLYEGSPLWEETDNVYVSKGIFSLTLGTGEPLLLPFDDVYYIAMAVDGGDELSPRNILTSTPYSYSSMNVWGIANMFPSTGNVGIGTLYPAEMLEVNGGVKLGSTSGTEAGTIRWSGGDFQGYDGAEWKSLTAAGGSSLPPGSAGATMRNNGSDWLSATNLYNDGSSIGIGTTSPGADLHLYASNLSDFFVESGNTAGLSNMQLLTPGGKFDYLGLFKYGAMAAGNIGGISTENLSAMFAGEDAGAILLGTRNAEPIHYITNNTERLRIESDGDVNLISDGDVVSSSYSNANGGALEIYSETGARNFALQPDANGTGGYFGVARNNTNSYGFRVDGNYNSTEEPMVSIAGSSRSVVFNMSQSGDESVALPVGSVSSAELSNEPGAASQGNSSGAYFTDTEVNVISSCTIEAPAPGYVFVIASGNVAYYHSSGVENRCKFGVSDNISAFLDDQDIQVLVSDVEDAYGYYYSPLTSHSIFEVPSAGSYTYYMLGQGETGLTGFFNHKLSCIYIPTSYGTVTASSSSAGSDPVVEESSGGLTAADIAEERARALEANAARMQSELDAMRAELEAMKRDSGNM